MSDILFWLVIIPGVLLLWIFNGLLLLEGWKVFKEWRERK